MHKFYSFQNYTSLFKLIFILNNTLIITYIILVFNEILKSIGEEKRLGKEFESVSGYSLYRVVQMSKNASKRIKMEQ